MNEFTRSWLKEMSEIGWFTYKWQVAGVITWEDPFYAIPI